MGFHSRLRCTWACFGVFIALQAVGKAGREAAIEHTVLAVTVNLLPRSAILVVAPRSILVSASQSKSELQLRNELTPMPVAVIGGICLAPRWAVRVRIALRGGKPSK